MAVRPAPYILLLKAPLDNPDLVRRIVSSDSPLEIVLGSRETNDANEVEDYGEGQYEGEGEERDESRDESGHDNARFCHLTAPQRSLVLSWLEEHHPMHTPTIFCVVASERAQRLTRSVDLARRGIDPTTPHEHPTLDNSSDSPRYPGPLVESTYYFFYGSLRDAGMLRRALHELEEWTPVYKNAKVKGWTLGEFVGDGYPALVEGPPDGVVEGVVWKCKSEEMAKSLAYYETCAYEEVGVRIEVEEEGFCWGRTFIATPDMQ